MNGVIIENWKQTMGCTFSIISFLLNMLDFSYKYYSFLLHYIGVGEGQGSMKGVHTLQYSDFEAS